MYLALLSIFISGYSLTGLPFLNTLFGKEDVPLESDGLGSTVSMNQGDT